MQMFNLLNFYSVNYRGKSLSAQLKLAAHPQPTRVVYIRV